MCVQNLRYKITMEPVASHADARSSKKRALKNGGRKPISSSQRYDTAVGHSS